jgi:hypothetical protein
MKTLYEFGIKKPNNPFVPDNRFVILSGPCFTIQECFEIKDYLLQKETELLKKHTNHMEGVGDAKTGLGNNSITSRFPYFSVFDFEHPFVEKIKQAILEYMQDICDITKTDWHSHLFSQSWFNVMRTGQKIDFHSHGFHENTLYGFHITIATENTSTIYHNPFDTNQAIEVSNDIGAITLFPNFIAHETTRYNGNDVRISIAGDIADSSGWHQVQLNQMDSSKVNHGIYREIGVL